ncbi:nickel/cobalt transporter [Mameliella sp.]|uniref:nickel/cobalt transporter n=1 Tax=Mameliella sp. TaxID=1924940 RepID=UPI003BA84D76
MRLILACLAIVASLAIVTVLIDTSSLAAWASQQQRAFLTDLARAVRALQTGQPGAWIALMTAAGSYGFVHAVGPGHGKYLIGGVGLGTSVPTARLLGLALASSLAQAIWAIVLVYGGFSLFELSARRMTALAEDILAPASYLAIASVGLVLVWRGVRGLARRQAGRRHVDRQAHHGHQEHRQHEDVHDGHGSCGCHAHGPTPQEVSELTSIREALALVGCIAVRPCTGAIFLLVIAWQMEIRTAGAAAVMVMGTGTAALTSLVAVSSTFARGMTWATANRAGAVALAFPMLQAFAGGLIVWISLLLFGLR